MKHFKGQNVRITFGAGQNFSAVQGKVEDVQDGFVCLSSVKDPDGGRWGNERDKETWFNISAIQTIVELPKESKSGK